jgi:hypothetical protein
MIEPTAPLHRPIGVMGITTKGTTMLKRPSHSVLIAGVMLATMALTAGNASAMGSHASGRSMSNHQTLGPSTAARGISMKPGKIAGLMPSGKVQGLAPPHRKLSGISMPLKSAHLGPIGFVPNKPLPVPPLSLKPIGFIPNKPLPQPLLPLKPIGFIPNKPLPLPLPVPPTPVGPIFPPVIDGVVPPSDVVATQPAEVTWTQRRYPWYSETAVSPAVSTAQAPCNCLTKEYLQDGSVLFKDLCTKEAAILTVEEMKAKM